MSHSEFVHLHNHTEYSLLDGACKIVDDKGKPADLLKMISQQYKMPALGITDHGNMYGAIEFYNSCRDVGVKPIIGCEVYMAPGSRFKKDAGRKDKVYYHLTLLSKNFEGYQNLMYLTSMGFLEGFYYKPRIDKELLKKHSKGIIALSGCMSGEIATLILQENMKEAEKVADEYIGIFGKDDFYIEIMDNGLEDQKKLIPGFLELAKKTGLKLVATNDCHYLRKEDAYDHDVLLCIGTGRTLDEPGRMKFSSNEFYYKSPEEMQKAFSFAPESIKSTLEIAEKTSLEINFDQILLPHYPVPNSDSPERYLEKLCLQGLKDRYKDIKHEHEVRLTHELSIIGKMGFAPYFLIVWDFIHYAKTNGIPVGPGRGSGAGSLVAYTLGITDICPLKYGLLFERFLNLERRSMPDLDIDLSDTGREQVIEYVKNKYGHSNCAQIITFGSMQARLVIRDVARVMGFTPAESDRIAKLIPFGSKVYSALQVVPELRNLAKTDMRVDKLITTAKKLEGLKRHTGVHAAGMVIAKEEITKFSPLAKGSRDVITTQYNDDSLLKQGLLKVDFLGLRTLTIIANTVKLIRRDVNPDFVLDNIPLNDKKTFKLFSDAKTLGVFQLESRGMRDLLIKLKPTSLEDIIALISLYRPGPMGSGMVDDFVSRKHQRTKVTYDHEILKPILEDTYGVILYQEQVMRIAQSLSGFSAGKADSLRKAMGKKIPEEMEKQRESFIDGAKAKGIDGKLAESIFEKIAYFGGYGFNKSHAAAYGTIAYQTAYLKANFQLQYTTALLNSEIGRSVVGRDNEDSKLVTYMQEAEGFGIKILKPDIQTSGSEFSIEGTNIRFGLLAIKNVGAGAVESIVDARNKDEKFKSWEDFVSKIDIHAANRKVLESLIKAGTLDCFGETHTCLRAELMAKLDKSINWANSQRNDVSRGQGLLFDTAELAGGIDKDIKVEAWSEHDTLSYEKEVLGFYLSGHPLAQHRFDLMLYSQYRLNKLPVPAADPRSSKLIRVVGLIASAKKLISKTKKEQYARFKLEDLHGEIEVVVFPRSYKNGLSKYIEPNNLVVVKGRLSGRDAQTELLAEEIMLLDEAKKKISPSSGTVRLKLSSAGLEDAFLDKIKKVIDDHPGSSPVVIDVSVPIKGDYSIETDYQVRTDVKFFQEIDKVLGKDHWEIQNT